MIRDPKKIRNIAIIAHVDHGKTTLVDAFMKQSNLFRSNQSEMNQAAILDSGDLEREKGITINAKNISIDFEGTLINIIDTPGHADFGGEVERTLNMADGVVLVVDAQEGPMPQTKFVLKKALELGLKPIVVINKIDKKFADPARAIRKVQDLFLNLVSDLDQLDFPVLYAIGREGKVFKTLPEGDYTIPNSIEGNVRPLLEMVVEQIPFPKGDLNEPFQMLVTSLEYDAHIGRYMIGKINRGQLKVGDNVALIDTVINEETKAEEQVTKTARVKKILVRKGMVLEEVDQAGVGEIIAVAGMEEVVIGSTLCIATHPEALPKIQLTPPSLRIKFEANTSPLVGRDGKFVTAKLLQQRLDREIQTNISLNITKAEDGAYYVAGRGELQLAILIETLRREGYEFQVRKPEIVIIEKDGVKMEPMEELIIDTNNEYSNAVAAVVTARRGVLMNIESEGDQVRYTYNILTRNLLGLRNELLSNTKGNVVVNNYLVEYVPFTKQPEPYRKGVLVAHEPGIAMAFTLNTVQWRGELFINPGEEVYEGMIVGINKYDTDLIVNVCKERHKSGVRVNQAAKTTVSLKAPIPLILDYALIFLASDEILEITPNHLRLRKALLDKNARRRSERD